MDGGMEVVHLPYIMDTVRVCVCLSQSNH